MFHEIVAYISVAARSFVGGLFVLGALTKWLKFQWFVGVLIKYDLTPRRAAPSIAFVIPGLEAIVGYLMLRGLWMPASMYATVGLLLTFTTAVLVNLVRNKVDVECGCNSLWKNSRIGWHLVCRNLGLIGLTLLSSQSWNLTLLTPCIFLSSLALFGLTLLPKRASVNGLVAPT